MFVIGFYFFNTDIDCLVFCVILTLSEQEEADMQESRLFQILYHLLQHGQSSAP